MPISACASSSRCRSPPDISDSGRLASSRAPTASSVCLDHARGRRPKRRQAPALAMQRAGDEIEAAHAQVRQHGAHLRQIADGAVAALRRAAEHADRSRARRQQAEDGAHQRGLAGAVRPEHADEFAGAESRSSHPPARCGRRSRWWRGRARRQFMKTGPPAPCRARRAAPASSPGTTRRPAAVSVTPTTGTLAGAAMSTQPLRSSLLGHLLVVEQHA